MLTSRRRAVYQAARHLATARRLAVAADPPDVDPSKGGFNRSRPVAVVESSGDAPSPGSSGLYGAAKLFADAELEEKSPSSSRSHLVQTQGPIWDGSESMHDNVLRMLVDAHKPLRSGTKSSDEKLKGWMKGVKLEPRAPGPSAEASSSTADFRPIDETFSPHRTKLPPHLHRPWHSTYTGSTQTAESTPKVKYGMFIRKRADGDALTNLLELQLPPGANGKARSRLREVRKAGKLVKRVERAKDGALDYRLNQSVDEEDDQFRGNRQVKGSSVLGAQQGRASGLRAWAGLVEDRIQRARGVLSELNLSSSAEAGSFKITNGKGKPIPRDPEAGNPHLGACLSSVRKNLLT